MQAILILNKTSTPYSHLNPAPASSLTLTQQVSTPRPTAPGELLIRNHASTVIRDQLLWPVTYSSSPTQILGRDLAGVVVAVHHDESGKPTSGFRPGDEVYGMTVAERASTWAEFAVAESGDVAIKPGNVGWGEAAAVPLSALTAWQGLFEVCALPPPPETWTPPAKPTKATKKLLVTGATGGVGAYLVQLSVAAGLHVTGATSSNKRSEEMLRELGAHEAVEYQDLGAESRKSSFDVIIDTVGGRTLETCWAVVKDNGILASLNFGAYGFVERHREQAFAKGKEGVNAQWFVVHPSGEQLGKMAVALEKGLLKGYVAEEFPFWEASRAYEVGNGKVTKSGKVVLRI